MSDKSAAQLEREAEAARARVFDTAETIRGKMTPGQLIDEFAGLFAGGESSAMLHNLKAQVRDNPLPVTLVGAGLAWLMFGNGNLAGASAPSQTAPRRTGNDHAASAAGITDKVSGAVSSVGSAISGAGESVSDLASNTAGRLSEQAGHLSSTATRLTANAGDLAANARGAAQDLLQREPLALAAVGLAVGAAIGAMLPHTAVEDQQFGAYGDKLRNSAKDMVDKGLDQAQEVAAETYQSVKDEADRQGSAQGTLADRARAVGRAAADQTERAVRERLPDSQSTSED